MPNTNLRETIAQKVREIEFQFGQASFEGEEAEPIPQAIHRTALASAANLIAESPELAKLEADCECLRNHLGDIVTYGTDAASLDRQLQEWVQRARIAEARNAKLREALKSLVKMAPPLDCRDFHHEKEDYHEGYNCPIEKRWNVAVASARAALAGEGERE